MLLVRAERSANYLWPPYHVDEVRLRLQLNFSVGLVHELKHVSFNADAVNSIKTQSWAEVGFEYVLGAYWEEVSIT